MEISAKIIADSVSPTGNRITTFELIYPRFIHGELMTHRMFSRNAASSRAIPINKMIEQVSVDPAVPVHWGKNQAGMQAKEEVSGEDKYGNDLKELLKARWLESAKFQASFAQEFSDHGLHKQVVNRILEPFQWMKTVVTATEWGNFFWLRNHDDAQPEIKRLAEVMLEAKLESVHVMLKPGEWHVPYVQVGRDDIGELCYFTGLPGTASFQQVSLEDALAISASCCAQVSYRLLDDSLEKARMIYKRLVESEPVHASPFEHQATPMKEPQQSDKYLWEDGMTHMDKEGSMWSGNFKGWIQHRKLIPNNYKGD